MKPQEGTLRRTRRRIEIRNGRLPQEAREISAGKSKADAEAAGDFGGFWCLGQ